MERTEPADAGYPEEQPPGAQPGDADGGDSAVRERAKGKAAEAGRRAPDNDDGTATGNPHTT